MTLKVSRELTKHTPAEGYTQIKCEVPVQKREACGAEFNGIIDLVATGDGRCLILDHKSGLGTFAAYFAQLRAYHQVLLHSDQTGFAEIAIHWIDRATLEIKDGSSQFD